MKSKILLCSSSLISFVATTVVSCSSSQGGVYAEQEFTLNKQEDVFNRVWNWQNSELQKYMGQVGMPKSSKVEVSVIEGEIIDTYSGKIYKQGSSFTALVNGNPSLGNFIAQTKICTIKAKLFIN